MDTQLLTTAATTGAGNSFYSLVWDSDWMTKIILLGLIAASVWTWAIIIEKIGMFKQLKMRTKSFEAKFWSGGSLDRLYENIGNKPKDPMSAMFVAAMKEWKRTNILKAKIDRGFRGVSLQQRIEKSMCVSMDKELEAMETRLGFLSSTGSVAPFVGLFGTVWGIMDCFQAIALTQNNSLSAIAPGIAEALFTTAFGLIAAIPAVIAYNKFSSDVDRYAKRLENFLSEFSSILSREIDDSAMKAEIAGE